MENSSSKKWLKPGTRQCLLRRALVKSMGYTDDDLARPIVGIVNTWAETNPGHFHFRQLAEAVKRGVWAAGGFPLEVNTLSICEVFFDVSSLIYRNLLSMTTEELIARHPFDGVVLLGSCDKCVPAQLMAAVSANKPAIFLPGGPMLPGNYKRESLACGTDSFKLWTRHLAGEIDEAELNRVEDCLYGSVGACPIMGTANSMQCAAESLGLSLPGSAASPAVSAEKMRFAELSGRRIMTLIERDIKPSDIVTRESMENCITVLMSSGGSTNLIIHLTAIAKRAGIDLRLSDFQRISDRTKVLVDVKPSGKGTVGIEFHQAGGVPALMKELEPLLHTEVMTVTGNTLKENLENVQKTYRPEVIAPLDRPFRNSGGIAVLYGNLAPRGAVIKRSAASILKFRGEARVFDTLAEAEKYLLDENSDMDENKAVILRGYGPKGAPGMPEFGNYMPIPPKLYKRGIQDYVRITDARMSGGAFGTVVLHVCPEACGGGPLGALRNGDIIEMDVEKGILRAELSDKEIAERLKHTRIEPKETFRRGFIRHYIDQVLQADEGCDFPYMQ
ncbi:MAG: L-arabonate dehydratase [Lentisphaerae bacterium ADurb.Bin242]|nr:MAG: L-arabonate dehydratase [Lentisphaerae bacterium ADurb.Bin242]